MPPRKPRHRSGYSREETLQVESALLTVAVTLGSHLDRVCIVGGIVPSLLIDRNRDKDRDDLHIGTNDLDVALHIGLLDDRGYAEVSERLRQEDFEPDENDAGNKVRQRWKLKGRKVTVDFLIPPTPSSAPGQIQDLESDFAAIATQGLDLAFDDRHDVEVDGHTLGGEAATRTIAVCGPAAFVALKALALKGRGERKDAYDLIYMIEHASGGAEAIARRLAEHAASHGEDIRDALAVLAGNFGSIDSVGPQRAAKFVVARPEEIDDVAADALGHVDDLLSACRELQLLASPSYPSHNPAPALD